MSSINDKQNQQNNKNNPQNTGLDVWSLGSMCSILPTLVADKQPVSPSLYVAEVINELPHDKTNKMAYAPSEDSDQPGHQPSLIRVFAVCSVDS